MVERGSKKSSSNKLLNLESNNAIAALPESVLNKNWKLTWSSAIDNDLQYLAYAALELSRRGGAHRSKQVGVRPRFYPSFDIGSQMEENWNCTR